MAHKKGEGSVKNGRDFYYCNHTTSKHYSTHPQLCQKSPLCSGHANSSSGANKRGEDTFIFVFLINDSAAHGRGNSGESNSCFVVVLRMAASVLSFKFTTQRTPRSFEYIFLRTFVLGLLCMRWFLTVLDRGLSAWR